MALSMVGITAPIVLVRLDTSAFALKFGEYPNASMARNTLSRVDSATFSGEFRTRDIVAVETLASRATSARVGSEDLGIDINRILEQEFATALFSICIFATCIVRCKRLHCNNFYTARGAGGLTGKIHGDHLSQEGNSYICDR